MLVKKSVKSVSALLILSVLLINSRHTVQAVKNSMLLCYNSVIPSLYIFMVFSNYISGSDNIDIFYYPFCIYSKLMKIKDKKYSSYLFLSLIGGFAVGSNFLHILEESGYDKKAIEVLSISMINNSLSFTVLGIGLGIMNNMYIGIILFVSTAAASLITCFIYSFFIEYNIVPRTQIPNIYKENFTSSVIKSVSGIINICGFVILFYCMCEVFSLYIKSDVLKSLFYSFMEISSATSLINSLFGNNGYIMCILLSLLPVSTLCQVYSFTQNKDIIKTLVFSRIIHCPVSLLIYSVLVNIFPVAVSTITPRSIAIKTCWRGMEVSAALFLITLSFILIFDSNKLFTKNRF